MLLFLNWLLLIEHDKDNTLESEEYEGSQIGVKLRNTLWQRMKKGELNTLIYFYI